MNDTVLYETFGAVAILTLNCPEQRNSVDIDLTHALLAALARFEADDTARIAILTGAGKVFCAGMDLKGEVSDQLEPIPPRAGWLSLMTRRDRTTRPERRRG